MNNEEVGMLWLVAFALYVICGFMQSAGFYDRSDAENHELFAVGLFWPVFVTISMISAFKKVFGNNNE